jgi:nucleoside-diphosphate-sugar epimerase
MIAAVTGGTGFIGRRLVEQLLTTFSEVRVLTRGTASLPGARMVRADLTGAIPAEALDNTDVLFHCAGELRNEAAMRALHVEGTRRLLAAARGRVARWVQLSSVGAYGQALREGIVDEAAPLAPAGEYENTKAEADALVAAERGLATVILRPSIVFGPGMPNRSLYQLVSVLDRGLFFFIGRGAVATYVYVDDVAQALLACGTQPGAAGVYNLSDDRPLEEFVGRIAAELGRPAPRRRVPEPLARVAARLLGRAPGFPLTGPRVDALTRRVRYPAARIERELGYRFAVSIEEGLRRFVADWRAQR